MRNLLAESARSVTVTGVRTPAAPRTVEPAATSLPADFGAVRSLPDAPRRDRAALRGRARRRRPIRRAEFHIPPVSHLPGVVIEGSRKLYRAVAMVIAVTCSLSALYLGWDLWGSAWYAARQQEELAAELATVTSLPGLDATWVGTPPATDPGPRPDPVILADTTSLQLGAPVGRIVIDKIGVDATFVYGTGVEELRLGPGVWEWGVLPGDPGNALIAGHRTTYGAPFHAIDQLTLGDQIRVEIPGRAPAVFEVRETQVVTPDVVSVSDQTPGVRLTLSACHPVGSARERIIVQAELVEGDAAAWGLPRDGWTFQR